MQMTGISFPRPFKSALKTADSATGLRWLLVWLIAGILIGVLLLANSVRDYLFVARVLTVQQIRQQVGQQITIFQRDLMENPASNEDLLDALSAELANGPTKPLWIVLRGPDGNEIQRTGKQEREVFTWEQESEHFRSRETLFSVVRTSSGEAVVEVFPIRVRASRPPTSQARDLDHRPFSAEIAVPLRLSDVSVLWSIRRNLIINSTAALVLLLTIGLTAVGLRSYLRGKQLEQQLELAREVQTNLFPGNVNVQTATQVAVEYQPAEEVAGDFYDVFDTPQGTAFVIGDVSGKGVPAALLVGVIHGAVRSGKWTHSESSHEQETAALNHLLCERASHDRYATMFWSYGNAETGDLNYVNAGHCPPILVSVKDDKPEIKRLDEGGTVLGLLPDAVYTQGRASVQPGDLIVLYSDGLVEATNLNGEEFGESRLIELLTESIGQAPEKIRNSIIIAVRAFLGHNSAQDDLTCVVVTFGAPASVESKENGAVTVVSS